MKYVVVNAVTTRVSRAHRIIGELFRLINEYFILTCILTGG